MTTKIAAVQMCSSSVVDDNLACAEQLIADAAKHGAELIVLPEMFAIMADAITTAFSVKETFGSGKIQTFLADQARKHNVWLVGGTMPLACDSDTKTSAALLVFDDHGRCVTRYNKIHLFDVVLSATDYYCESDTIEPGHHLAVMDSPFGHLGFAVCYDIRFPELFRCLFNQGAQLFILPAAFTETTGKAHWEVLARSRAIENFCYMVGACQGGQHANGRHTYGHSLIVDPWGRVIARKDGIEPGVITAVIDLTVVHQARQAIPVDKHQRIVCDASGLSQGQPRQHRYYVSKESPIR